MNRPAIGRRREDPVGATEFRKTVGNFATGVTVITTRDADENPRGFTANAFSSLSLEPPLVIVCVNSNSETGSLMQEDGAFFAVNILSDGQEELSARFARRGGSEKYAGVDYREEATGAPVLEGVLAYLECRTVGRFEGGDHTIVVGEVLNAAVSEDAGPLLFYRGSYGAFQPFRDLVPARAHPLSFMFWDED
jgi:flavin reductase (DIM6/NTAB) family NADH-FMN oxidoreductase RutF